MFEKRKIDGERVSTLRERKGWSQRQLGEMVGLSQAGVNTVEKGYESSPGVHRSTSVEKFIRLADALDTNLHYLTGQIKDARPINEILAELEALKDSRIAVSPNNPKRSMHLRTLLEDGNMLTDEDLQIIMNLAKRLRDSASI